MQSFKEIRFPDDISYGSSGGPRYSTDVITISNGKEQRNINWANARCKYNVAFGVKNKEQLDKLINFFRIMKGRAYGFRFKDWCDYQVIDQTINISNGIKKNFQLFKSYDFGEISEKRIIRKLVEGTVKIYLDNILCKNIHIDHDNGIFSLSQAPAKGVRISADFEYDVPVRFDTDSLSAVIEDYGTYSWPDIAIIEIKL